MMVVTNWPSYLLRSIPEQTLLAMHKRALDDDISLADVVRQAMCARYGMDCGFFSPGYQTSEGSGTLLVRIQPEVWKKMKRDTTSPETGNARYGEMRTLILNSLDDYLEVSTQP